MAQFFDLPDELQLKIFELALYRDCQSRVVEIYLKSGEIYSQTLPPPLLHVCQLSRWVTLKRYKPWLPQFRDKPWHAPYEKMVKQYGDRLSRLNNICIDLEKDILLIDKQQWANWAFGPLEKGQLRFLGLNLSGWIHWSKAGSLLQQFRELRKASVFDNGKNDGNINFKISEITNWIAKTQQRRKNKAHTYVAPAISVEFVSVPLRWTKETDQWITYQYPKDYVSRRADVRVERSIEGDRFAGIFGSLRSAASPLDTNSRTDRLSLTRPTKTTATRIPLPPNFSDTAKSHSDSSNFSSLTNKARHDSAASESIILDAASTIPSGAMSSARKRKQDDDIGSESSFLKVRKLAEITNEKDSEQYSYDPTPLRSVEEHEDDFLLNRSFVFPDLEDFDFSFGQSNNLPTITTKALPPLVEDMWQGHNWVPENDPLVGEPLRASWEVSADKSFADIFEDIEFLRTPSPEPNHEKLISSPLNLNSSPFQSPSKSCGDLSVSFPSDSGYSSIGSPTSSPSFINRKVAFDDLYDEEKGDLAQVDDHEFSYLAQASQPRPFAESENDDRSGQSDSPSRQLFHEIQHRNSPQPESQPKSTIPVFNRDGSPVAPCRNSVPVVEIWVTSSMAPLAANPANGMIKSVPEYLVAERLVAGHREYLVKWENEARESWVKESSIMKTASRLVTEWRARSTALNVSSMKNQEILEYIVEKILGKRTIRGVPSYLVKWEGYSEMKDRTWEPCDRLQVDVPTLVEEYESKQKKRRRRRS